MKKPLTSNATAIRIEKLKAGRVASPHGTRSRYMLGCRCLLCRSANSRYQCDLDRRHAAGDVNPIVDAHSVREHLLRLRRQGVGYKAAADAAGVARTIVAGILSSERSKCRLSTLNAVLSVDKGALSGGAVIPAGGTWRILNELINRGYTKSWLAKQLGSKSETPALQIRKDKVTASTAMRVEQLYGRLNAGKIRRDA